MSISPVSNVHAAQQPEAVSPVSGKPATTGSPLSQDTVNFSAAAKAPQPAPAAKATPAGSFDR